MNTFSRVVVVAAALLFTGQGCLSFSNQKPAAAGPAGIWVSVDKGDTWQQISRLPTAEGVKDLSGASVYRLFTDPQDSAALYWASRENGFFFSYDEGRTWQQPKDDLAKGFIYGITVDPRDRCTLFVSNGRQVLRSDDCSRSWQEVYLESRLDTKVASLAFNPTNPKQLLVLLGNGDLLETFDQGETWEVINRFDVDSVEIFADPLQRDVFYVATSNAGLYRSIDGGETWVSLLENMSDFSRANEFRRFYAHPSKKNILYWVSTYGILRSDNGGDTWESIDLITPAGSAQIYGFAVNPNNEQEIYYTATINGRSTFYRTFDGGIKWATKKLPSGQLPTVLYVHPEKEEIIYAGFTIPPSS